MSKQKGFAHAMLTVGLVVALVGTLGVIFWQNFISKDEVAKKTETVKQEDKKQEIEKKDSTPSLTIKEWGVKIPLSLASTGAYYKLDPNSDQSVSEPVNLVVFSSKTDALVGPAGTSCKGEHIAYLLRLPANDERWQTSKTVDDGRVAPYYTNRTVVGDYRYAVATLKQYVPTCFMANDNNVIDTETSQKFDAVANAFKADFKKIQAE